ncbi:MAG: DUF1667 domain-containing protein [Lachnospiraceae bacterium]|nr:DUF1667 domain-containing protein [Lachnospiraceae bacterium]
MEKKELVCICCPLGCSLTAEIEESGEVRIFGNTCNRGEDYGKKEMTNPTRIVTTTVRVKGGVLPALSVKTQDGVPRNKVSECIQSLRKVEVEAPVHVGDIVLTDVAGTGVGVVATKEVRKCTE